MSVHLTDTHCRAGSCVPRSSSS